MSEQDVHGALTISSSSGRGDAGAADSWQVSLPKAFMDAYVVGRMLGAGAMGSVYEALQRSTSRTVAIKFMKDPDEPEAVERFVREGQVMARIGHPGVLRVIDCGRMEGSLYLVTELHSGGSLRDRMYDGPAFTAVEAVELVAQILDALAACHAQEVIHRDLKPANVLLSVDSAPILADFGLARLAEAGAKHLTRTGTLIGTPMYMAPEQLRGKRATPAIDLYAAAAILFEMFNGKPPRALAGTGDAWDGSLAALEELIPEAPPGVRAVLHRALDDDPSRRPDSAHEMAEALRHPELALRVTGRTPGPRRDTIPRLAVTLPPRQARPRTAVAAVMAVAVPVLVGIAVLVGFAVLARRPVPPDAVPSPPVPVPDPTVQVPAPVVDPIPALTRLAGAQPADLHGWLVNTFAARVRRSGASTRPALIAVMRDLKLHADLETVLERPAPADPGSVPAAEREAWAAAGWIELLERSLLELRAKWPYPHSFAERMGRLWPLTPAARPVDRSWETHIRGVMAPDQLDLRFRLLDDLRVLSQWYPYEITLKKPPAEARIWFGMGSPQPAHALIARFGGHRTCVIPIPSSVAPGSRRLELVPASVIGGRAGSWGNGVFTLFTTEVARHCYTGRIIPVSWLREGRNTVEITSVVLDGTDAFVVGPAIWVKALSIR